MKPRIKTQVLNGFIRQAVSHNKYIEEQEMWNKRQGIRQSRSSFNYGNIPSQSKYSDHDDRRVSEKRQNSSDENEEETGDKKQKETTQDNDKIKGEETEEIDDLKVMLALYQDAKNFQKASEPKWTHDGFFQLQKDEEEKNTKKKWDHGGYLSLNKRNPNVSVARFEIGRFRERDTSSDDSEKERRKRAKKHESDEDDDVSSTSNSSEDDSSKRKKSHHKKKKKKKKKSSHSKHKKKKS